MIYAAVVSLRLPVDLPESLCAAKPGITAVKRAAGLPGFVSPIIVCSTALISCVPLHRPTRFGKASTMLNTSTLRR